MGTKIKRSQFKLFLNTGTPGTPTWVPVGEGITDAQVQYNPEKTTETYITDDGATVTLERYAPNIPIDAQAINGNADFEYIDNLRRTRAIGTAAETEVLLVYLYETPVATDQYPAERQGVTISIDTFGGPGGQTNRINYTIDFRGNPTTGLYDVSANSFA